MQCEVKLHVEGHGTLVTAMRLFIRETRETQRGKMMKMMRHTSVGEETNKINTATNTKKLTTSRQCADTHRLLLRGFDE